jgi:hypothetical protein
MPVTSKVYSWFLNDAMGGDAYPAGGRSLYVMLCSSVYTWAPQHRYKSEVNDYEVSGPGYGAGGMALPVISTQKDLADGKWSLHCYDIIWPSSTITARYAVFYMDNYGSDDYRNLMLCWDFGEDVSSSDSDFTLQTASTGLLTLDAAVEILP